MAKRRGKYAHLIDLLERKVGKSGEPISFRDKVNTIKRNLAAEQTPITGVWLANEVAAARRKKAELKKEATDLNAEVQALEEMLIDQYEVEGVTAQTLEDGVSIRVELSPVATAADKDKIREWALNEGLERLLTIHPSTLTSLVKEKLMAAGTDKDAIFQVVKTLSAAGIEAQTRTKVVARGLDDDDDGSEFSAF